MQWFVLFVLSILFWPEKFVLQRIYGCHVRDMAFGRETYIPGLGSHLLTASGKFLLVLPLALLRNGFSKVNATLGLLPAGIRRQLTTKQDQHTSAERRLAYPDWTLRSRRAYSSCFSPLADLGANREWNEFHYRRYGPHTVR